MSRLKDLSDVEEGLAYDKKALEKVRGEIEILERGGHVENLTLPAARRAEDVLMSVIYNKRHVLLTTTPESRRRKLDDARARVLDFIPALPPGTRRG
jgi:hypothetical protein